MLILLCMEWGYVITWPQRKKDEVELIIHFYVQLFIYFYVKDISFLIEKVNKLFIVQYLTNAESTCNSTICKDLPVK